jgi:hypothetical protein
MKHEKKKVEKKKRDKRKGFTIENLKKVLPRL